MSDEFTTSYINAVGRTPQKSRLSLRTLSGRSFDDAYKGVIRSLRDLGLEPSGRIKSTISITAVEIERCTSLSQ